MTKKFVKHVPAEKGKLHLVKTQHKGITRTGLFAHLDYMMEHG